jgi:hypothetical protein
MTTTTGPPKPVPILDAQEFNARYGSKGPRFDAARRVLRIRQGLADAVDAIWQLKVAWDSEDWKTLGYASWQEYTASEYANGKAVVLTKAERQELAAALHDTMSVRAIAVVLGVSVGTVASDLKTAGVQELNTSPEPPQLVAVQELNTSPGPPGDAADASPQVSAPQPAKPKLSVVGGKPKPTVKGLDGKQHPKSKPAQPKQPKPVLHPDGIQVWKEQVWRPGHYGYNQLSQAREALKNNPDLGPLGMNGTELENLGALLDDLGDRVTALRAKVTVKLTPAGQVIKTEPIPPAVLQPADGKEPG